MSIRSRNNSALAFLFIFISFCVLPSAARAAVVINEVMYNPEGSDSGREWVELYNDGSADATLVGGTGKGSWRIADSANHSITDPAGGVGRGSLVVPAGGYLVLASDPAVFMGEYSGSYSVAKASLSLNNTGLTVALIDGDGSTVSSVAYAASQGGDDNGTSLQAASSTWIEALPTPGAQNAAEAYHPPHDESSSNSGSSKAKTEAPSSGFVPPPMPQIFADGGEDRTVIVGADTLFQAHAYDRAQTAYKSAKFIWNFGDGTLVEGSEAMHHFAYPGEYAVELSIADREYSGSTRIVVEATTAQVGMALLPGGGVAIKNGSGRDLDLSFWQVAQGTTTFALPPRSVVLDGASINISPDTLGFAAGSGAELRYPNGTPVPSADLAAASLAAPAQAAASAAPAKPAVLSAAPVAEAPAPQAAAEATSSFEAPAPQELAASVAQSGQKAPLWPLAGLGGLVAAGVLSTVALRRKGVTTEPAEEFTIE
jgi:hypothetical protein